MVLGMVHQLLALMGKGIIRYQQRLGGRSTAGSLIRIRHMRLTVVGNINVNSVIRLLTVFGTARNIRVLLITVGQE